MDTPAELVSGGVTTGWANWAHGELWLMPDGIMRVSSGLGETMRHGLDTQRRRSTTFSEAELNRIAGKPGNTLIRREDIEAASLRRGLLNGRLRLQLRDGRAIKLLWLRRDGVDRKIQPLLEEWLGSHLRSG